MIKNLITISLSNVLRTSRKQRIKSNCYWKHLYTIEQQYICYLHLQLFNETLQHKLLEAITYGDEYIVCSYSALWWNAATQTPAHDSVWRWTCRVLHLFHEMLQHNLLLHTIRDGDVCLVYSYSLYNETLQHWLFHTIIYEMNVLCNPIQRFNTCCILILHSSTKCCNWNTCTQLQMRWTFCVVVFCSSTKCCNRNSCTGLHMRWMCCTLIFCSSMKCCNKLQQGIMHGIKIPYTRIQHLNKTFQHEHDCTQWLMVNMLCTPI